MDNRHLPSPRKLAIAVEYRITFGIQTKTNIYRSIALSIHLSIYHLSFHLILQHYL